MIEMVFALLFGTAVITFILGLFTDDDGVRQIILCMLSTMLWLVIMAQSHYIEVPGVSVHSELAVSAMSLAFILVNIITIIIAIFHNVQHPGRDYPGQDYAGPGMH